MSNVLLKYYCLDCTRSFVNTKVFIMIRSSVVCLLLSCVICSFCGNDFVSLGRHQWRCKEKSNEIPRSGTTTPTGIPVEPVIDSPSSNTSKRVGVKCCCGKICKGARGLKMHQRSCKIISGLNEELLEDLKNQDESNNDDTVNLNNGFVDSNTTNEHVEKYPQLKPGINLPKSDSEWLTANEYFKFTLPLNAPIRNADLNTSISILNNTIYNYFAENFGYVESLPDKSLKEKYENHNVKDLKKALKTLKTSKSNLAEIKYVSRLLRKKLVANTVNKATDTADESLNHDNYVERNFWAYVKYMFDRKDLVLPTFTMTECFTHFKNVLAKVNPNKLFKIPDWIPMLPDPINEFDLTPPTYQQITNIIRKMKTSGSPCPLDQISIICFKRCPYLRSYLTELIQAVWLSGNIPEEWKKACTILIHKKDNSDSPSNFRPITLQTIPLKVFTSCLRKAMFTFLLGNNLIEHKIQKGFTPKVSGTFEHTAQMAHIINQARTKQRSVVITLLDLKNAFGEVHHNLIQSVLCYHHIPDHIKILIKSLYTNFQTSIIHVGRGVLQGDCLSPLLFNLCFNTFVQHIKSDKYRFGFQKTLIQS